MKKALTLGVTLLAGLSLTACGANNSNETSTSSGKKTTQTTKAPKTSKITVDYNDYKVSSSKTYKVNYEDTDWDEANVKINKVTVYKLADPYEFESSCDGTYNINGFIELDMTVKANDDISIYPSQGTAIIGEEQEDAILEGWDGEINNGAEKSGKVYIPVKNLGKATNISNLRFKFSGNNQNDYADDYDYDLTFDLYND